MSAVAAPLLSLTYVSTASTPMTPEQLGTLLAQVRPANRAREVTGMLLYRGGEIIQTLEGDPAVVEALFDTIHDDERHHGVLVVHREEVARRSFDSWSMGFRDVGGEAEHLEGWSDFLRSPLSDGLDAHAGAAWALLALFRETRG